MWGVSVIPKDSVIYRLIRDLREWNAQISDWRNTREKIAAKYGYDKYGGGCHMVPNHALIIHALLHGEGDFQKSLMIVNTCGWDTDCNSGNVGCLLGIRGGLAALEDGPDWRGPVADRLLLPTADGGRSVSDALAETYHIVNIARVMHGQEKIVPKNGARFHFSLPGSVQGFQAENSIESKGTVRLQNVAQGGTHKLALHYFGVSTGRPARVATPTFPGGEAMKMTGSYSLLASPTLYAGQRVRASVSTAEGNVQTVTCRLYIRAYNEDGNLQHFFGPGISLEPSSTHELSWNLDGSALDIHGLPIVEVGLEISSEKRAEGTIYLDFLTWDGAPDVILRSRGKVSQQAWVNGADSLEKWWGGDYRIQQNEGRGLLIQEHASGRSTKLVQHFRRISRSHLAWRHEFRA
jgi:hypothetical protein